MKARFARFNKEKSVQNNDYCRADINADRIAELRHCGDLGNFHTVFTAKLINRSDDSFFCVQRNKDLCGCAVPNRFFSTALHRSPCAPCEVLKA